MQTLHYSISIEAPRDHVWRHITTDELHRQWVYVFAPGMYLRGEWKAGNRVMFLAPNEDETESGTVSIIEHHRVPEFISIKHIGFCECIDAKCEQMKLFVPAYENYTLTDTHGGTVFTVDADVTDEYYDFMNETWPSALLELKDLCERSA